MSIETHRKKIRSRMRQQYISKTISNMRQKVSSQLSRLSQREQDIIDSLDKSMQKIQSLDGEAIFHAVANCKSQFSDQFLNRFAESVVQYWRTNCFCLNSLSCLIARYKSIQCLKRIHIGHLIEDLFQDNSSQEGKVSNLQAIICLITNLMRIGGEKEAFSILQKYQSLIDSLGYFDLTYMRFIYECLVKNILYSQECILFYLEHDLHYCEISAPFFQEICSIFTVYFSRGKSSALEHKLILWIKRRFNQLTFPDDLALKMVSLLSFLLKSSDETASLVKNILKSSLLDVLCQAMKIKNYRFKSEILRIISKVLGDLQISSQKQIIEKYDLLQLVMNSLSLQVDNQLTFNLLYLLALIIQTDPAYLQLAHSLGIVSILNYYQSAQNVRLSQMAEGIITYFNLF